MELRDAMTAFVRVVDAGTFAGAARELHMPKSTVSRWVQALEDRVGAQLLVRTPRSITLTDAGAIYLEKCREILALIRDADDAVMATQAEPTGVLRITGPQSAGGGFIGQMALDFLIAHPHLAIDLVLTNRYVNLEAEGFDVAVRAGQLEDSALMSRKMASTDRLLVASPGYLNDHGVPTSIDDLSEHNCLTHTGSSRTTWSTRDGRRVQVHGRLQANDLDTLYLAALRGLGIAPLPRTFVDEAIRDGRLTEVLPGSMSAPSGIYLVYPASRHLSPKVRAFLDFGSQWFARSDSTMVRS